MICKHVVQETEGFGPTVKFSTAVPVTQKKIHAFIGVEYTYILGISYLRFCIYLDQDVIFFFFNYATAAFV